MRFAIIGSRGYPSTYSGFETLVRHLAPFLAAKGHEVTVYCRPSTDRLGPDAQVEQVFTRGVDSKSASTLTYGLSSTLHAMRRQYDAALVLNVANGYYLPILARAGIPTAVNVDGIEWNRAKWGPLAKRVFRSGADAVAKYADILVADSQAIAIFWKEAFEREPIFIPYGAPISHPTGQDLTSILGTPDPTFALLVARMVPENNVHLALDAFERDTTRTLAVVGQADFRSSLTDRLNDLGRRHDDLRVLGHIADQSLLHELWARSDVYIHGHSVGGTNPSLLQAMGAGAPVVAFDTVYNREVLPRDAPFFSSADVLDRLWTDLLRNPAEARAQGLANRKRVASAYRWEDVNQAYLEVLLRLSSA